MPGRLQRRRRARRPTRRARRTGATPGRSPARAAAARRARPARPARRPRRRRGGRRTRRRGAGAARAGSRPAARRAASCGRRARTCPCPWSRGSAAAGSSRRARGRLVVTAPPSPNAPRFFDGKNENVAIVPSAPGRPAAASEPAACAASSTTGTPSASISAIGATLPNRCTAITAFVRGVSAARTVSAVTQHVSGSTSQKTGRAPRVRDRLGGGVEGEGGDDDLVAGPDAERAQREHERVGPVGHAGGVARAQVGGELALEGGDLGAEDERAAVDDLGDLRVDLGAQRRERRLRVEQRDGHPRSLEGASLRKFRARRRCGRP